MRTQALMADLGDAFIAMQVVSAHDEFFEIVSGVFASAKPCGPQRVRIL
jgi:hypothetical protein